MKKNGERWELVGFCKIIIIIVIKIRIIIIIKTFVKEYFEEDFSVCEKERVHEEMVHQRKEREQDSLKKKPLQQENLLKGQGNW